MSYHTTHAAIAEGAAGTLCGVDWLHLAGEDINGLGIGGTQRETVVFGVGSGVTIGLIGRIVAQGILLQPEVYTREVGILVLAVAIVDVSAKGDIASVAVHAAVDLHLRTDVSVIAITQ